MEDMTMEDVTAESTTLEGFYSPRTYKPEQSLGFLAGRCLNKITDAIDFALKERGLNSQRFGILHAILRGDARSPTELAQLRYRNGAAITYTLNTLEREYLLERLPSTKDRRITELRLTEKGEALTRACIPLVIDAQNRVLDILDHQEYALLSSLLRKLAYGETVPGRASRSESEVDTESYSNSQVGTDR